MNWTLEEGVTSEKQIQMNENLFSAVSCQGTLHLTKREFHSTKKWSE